MKIAFDIDDTLIIPSVANDTEKNIWNEENIKKYFEHKERWDYMILWSGSWTKWCEHWNEKLWLNADEIRQKIKSDDIDICYDDCIVNLAIQNIRVKRIRNNISRKDWNKTKRFIS